MEIDVTENVTSNSRLLCYQKKPKEIQAREIKLKKNLSYEGRDLDLEENS